MSSYFITYLSLSLSGAILIALMILTKKVVKKKFSKTWQYYIWIVVILRLLVPVSSQYSVMNQVFQKDVSSKVEEQTPIYVVPSTTESSVIVPSTIAPNTTVPNTTAPSNITSKEITPIEPLEETPVEKTGIEKIEKMMPSILDIATYIWLAVADFLLIWKVCNYIYFRIRIRKTCLPVIDENIKVQFRLAASYMNLRHIPEIYMSEEITTPMYTGLLNCCVIMPIAKRTDEEYFCEILHELTHYRRKDALYSWLVQLTVCLHWFNPMVYLMQKEINHACELSCDEKVIRKMDYKSVRVYGDTLINTAQYCVTKKTKLNALAFSEKNGFLKERILAIMNFKKINWLVVTLMSLTTICLVAGAYLLGGYNTRTAIEKRTGLDLSQIYNSNAHRNQGRVLNFGDGFGEYNNECSWDNNDYWNNSYWDDDDSYDDSCWNYDDSWDDNYDDSWDDSCWDDSCWDNNNFWEGDNDWVGSGDWSSTNNQYNMNYLYYGSKEVLASRNFSTEKSFYWNKYVYDFSLTNNELDKTSFYCDIAVSDKKTIKVYFKTAEDLDKFKESADLKDLLTRIEKDTYQGISKKSFCILNKYQLVEDVDKAATDSFEKGEKWIFGAIYPEINDTLKTQYISKAYEQDDTPLFALCAIFATKEEQVKYAYKAYDDRKMPAFSICSSALSKEDKLTIAKKAYDDDEISYFCIVRDGLSSKDLKELKERAEKDKKVSFSAVIANDDYYTTY